MGRFRKATTTTTATTSTTTNIIQPIDWTTIYNGYGYVQWGQGGVTFQPKTSIASDETHAVMILKNNTSLKDFTVKYKAKTNMQLRLNNPPNAWECFWFVFNYLPTPDGFKTANYVVLKPNGVELGTMDSSVGQKFLYTGGTPKLTIGNFNTYELTKVGKNLKLVIDGATIFNQVFDGLYDQAGTFGLYSEDAACTVESVISG